MDNEDDWCFDEAPNCGCESDKSYSEMTVSALKAEIKGTEKNIAALVANELAIFEKKTGCNPDLICINMADVSTVDCNRKKLVLQSVHIEVKL